MFSLSSLRLLVCPLLPIDACKLCCAWQRVEILPHLRYWQTRTHCCRHKCFPVFPRATFVADTNFVSGTQKMFLILFRNILFPQQMFPSLRSPRKIMSINVSATMCPRLPVPLALVTCFRAIRTGRMFSLASRWYMCSRAYHWLHVFPPFALVTCFPALCTGYMFSRLLHWLHVFPPFALVTCFPTLRTGYMLSHASPWLHIFPR